MKHLHAKPRRKEKACIIGCLAALLITVLATEVRAQTESVLYTFAGASDGGVPYAGLVSDKGGNLYGTTMQYGDGPCAYPFGGCGTVFELIADQEGTTTQWTFKLLYAFQGGADGADPASTLILDSAGHLYGTTTAGGTGCGGLGCGTVFELEWSGSEWSENVLYRFTGSPDGRDPVGSLTLDRRGNLYGTTAFGGDNNCITGYGVGCGVVFRLSPTGTGTATAWSETILHTFHGNDGANPYAGVTLAPPTVCGDVQSSVSGTAKPCIFGTASFGGYGTVEPGGVVFQLVPRVGTLKYNLLYAFPDGCGGPGGPLLLDKSGTLYGMTHLGGQYCSGSVFTLSRNSITGLWSEANIYSFSGPEGWFPMYQGVVMDEHGNLYGTTSSGGTSPNCEAGCGTVFRLSKATGVGWYESALYSLQGGAQGDDPLSGNLVLRGGQIYGMTPVGGDMNCSGLGLSDGCGLIYSIGP